MATDIRNVSKVFSKTTALHSINLSINDGEFVAILGPSGCGKTTLLRLLAGFDSPSEGEIYMNGQCVSEKNKTTPPEKRNIGMVFQSFALWPHMNVKEHIRFPLLHHQFVKKEMKANPEKRIEEVLQIVNLQSFSHRMPHELSGGQKQRVALARAIAPKPALLLMDEPLSSLDAELRMDMRREIQQLHRITGATIIYVTHDQEEALAMADKIVVMNNGKIEQFDTPQQIYYNPLTEFVAKFVGKANIIEGIWRDEITFEPFGTSTPIQWKNIRVESQLKEKNLCPVRPEQFSVSDGAEGFPGEVMTVQFQGKEIHYSIKTKLGLLTIHEDALKKPFRVGDHVSIMLKQPSMRNEYAKTSALSLN